MKQDLRVQKTRRAIREAFIELVEERGYKRVTVQDIAQRAEINRNTFYLHYLDKEDMVDTIVHELRFAYQQRMDTFVGPFDSTDRSQVVLRLRSLLTVLNEDVEFYRILLTDESLGWKYSNLTELLREFGFAVKSPVNDLRAQFALSGLSGLISQWIIYATGTVDELAETAGDLFLQCLEESDAAGSHFPRSPAF